MYLAHYRVESMTKITLLTCTLTGCLSCHDHLTLFVTIAVALDAILSIITYVCMSTSSYVNACH